MMTSTWVMAEMFCLTDLCIVYKVHIESVTGVSHYMTSIDYDYCNVACIRSHCGSHIGFTNIACKWYISDPLRCGKTQCNLISDSE